MDKGSHLLTDRRTLLGGIACTALAGTLPFGAPAHAQQGFEQPTVIELFTSQGCSSCPPADELLAKLARQPNVVALSFSVDYWDYIGWKDTFASPAFTARQKAYASARRDGHVYTPQAIVNGLDHAVGSDAAAIDRAARATYGRQGAMQALLDAKLVNGDLLCRIGPAPAGAPSRATLWLYRVLSARDVKIGRGENRGRKVTYVNIVRSVQKFGEWDGKAAQLSVSAADLKKGGSEGWVLLLQAGAPGRPGPVLGAAKAPGF